MPNDPVMRYRTVTTCLVAATLAIAAAHAQELAPRAYWPMPAGTNVLVPGYQYSTGDIVTDPSLPLIGVDSEIHFALLSYQRTFGLWGRTANVQVNLPYSEGDTEGFVNGEFRTREVAGMADTRIRFAINLKGAPVLDRAAFQALTKNPVTIVGASLLIQAPTGEYEHDKVINLGTNRWAVKPAIGVIKPLGPSWFFEFDAGVWLFGENDSFLGETRKQDPILSTEFHLIKEIRAGFWASLDANFYVGGSTRVGNGEKINLQRNSRIGITTTFPIRGRHALRGSFSTGAVTESGGDFESFALSYIYAW